MSEQTGWRPPQIDQFYGDPTRKLEDWAWLWDSDATFPMESHRPVVGKLFVWFKKLVRPLVKSPQNDLWDRQRIFNTVLISNILPIVPRLREMRADLDGLDLRIKEIQQMERRALEDVMQHNDGLFAMVEQKVDHYQRESRVLWGQLGAALATLENVADDGSLDREPTNLPAETATPVSVEALSQAREEASYVQLERLFRGTEEEITDRTARYLPYLEGCPGELLDLGCGRGEALQLFGEHGLSARGVDSSLEMVEACRVKGVRAVVGDLFDRLAAEEESSLGAVVSFHVIEHLPPKLIDRLVRLAWRALKPGGRLILETPSPLSVVVAARNFWVDPTHQRPVHPDSLKLLFEVCGFEPVERLDLRPFPDEMTLPEIDVAGLPDNVQHVGQQINAMRDRLDEVLFGYQDFGMVGTKP